MRIGIDWGGTKIEAIALSDGGAVLARKRVATPQHNYESLHCRRSGACARDRGGAGTDRNGGHRHSRARFHQRPALVKNANSVWLNGRSLDMDMARGSWPGRTG